jgi:2-C-methyl-D-erythritol 2,4-cyclodiphosphate synthase
MRIGQGYDVHAFGPGEHVMLGGVRIAHTRGVVAHSDGDVLLHAICDALLGAAALGDIGVHFPPGDARWRGADSRDLLRRARDLIREAGYAVGNVDATVVCEAPKVMPHASAMRAVIAVDLGCAVEQVSIKATTSERLGFVGRGEGIAALAVALLLPA